MRSSTTTCGGPRESEGPFAACAEGVEIGGRFMGCVPFLAKEMGTTMGPATGLPTLHRASVTVARLCRILTGFADPVVLSSVGRPSVRLFPRPARSASLRRSPCDRVPDTCRDSLHERRWDG